MAIQPISRTDYVSHVSFEGGHKKGNKRPDGGQHMTSAAKAIPVVVLMAMSPLTQCATAGNYNRQIASSPTTEVVVQNPQEPEKPKLPDTIARSGNKEFLRVWGVSDDDNPNDAEAFLFNYVKALDSHKVAVLAGQFLAMSDTPREDGRYLMMYSPLDESGHVNGEYEIAYLPEKFIVPPNYAANSPANNKASVIAPWGAFVKKFGEEAVKNAPNIEDATNFVLNKKY